jgi:HAD superfamily hydrolase (TIGR01484 family)
VPIEALATDYDGTLAAHGAVADATLAALQRLKASGRTLVMVTGRELPDLGRVFPHADLFDAIVAENGALLSRPATGEACGETRQLAPAPPAAFIAALLARNVAPLAVGQVIVATGSENAPIVQSVLDELGLHWRLILNKDSVMCLPAGVDKASGLAAALRLLGLSDANVLGVGDAENDHAFLAECGVSAAVAGALPELKAAVDIVTPDDNGAGVRWLIDRLLADPASLARRSDRPSLAPT